MPTGSGGDIGNNVLHPGQDRDNKVSGVENSFNVIWLTSCACGARFPNTLNSREIMDAVFGSSDAIVPMKRKSVFTVDAHEEDMLNFGFDFTNYEFPLDSSSINFLGA